MLCWLLLSVSWLILLLLVPIHKIRLSFYIGEPFFGLCLLHIIFLAAAWVSCWNTSVAWWFICHTPLPLTFSFCCIVPSVSGHFYLHAVNYGMTQPPFLPWSIMTILSDVDLMSALQWTLSWPSGRVSCSIFSVPDYSDFLEHLLHITINDS